jgi:hypothetical protein
LTTSICDESGLEARLGDAPFTIVVIDKGDDRSAGSAVYFGFPAVVVVELWRSRFHSHCSTLTVLLKNWAALSSAL